MGRLAVIDTAHELRDLREEDGRAQPKQDDELRDDHTAARRRLGQALRDRGAGAHESEPLGEDT